MKNVTRNLVLTGLISTGLLGFSACSKDQANSDNVLYASILDVTEEGASSVINENLKSTLLEIGLFNENDLEVLVTIKEEEKLARDVYSALGQKWNNQVFNRITQAENTHMSAIVLLLGNYGADYTQILEPGKFVNSTFQLLYNELVSKGSVSVAEAYKVGALIEEMDIADITSSMVNVTDANITVVFENLTKGSRNHLRAFNRQLTALGLTYTPVYLSKDEYTQIASTPTEAGKRYRMNGNVNSRFCIQ